MIRRQIESPMPRPVALVEKNGSNIARQPLRRNAVPVIADATTTASRLGARFDFDEPAVGRRGLHRVHRVDEEIHEHLLQLDARHLHGRQLRRERETHFDLSLDQFSCASARGLRARVH